MNKKLHTKFGTAVVNHQGYYHIVSRKEGNKHKILHRLIWEDYHNEEIPKDHIIHHKDGNKLNNCILNLEILPSKEHNVFHNSGENNPMYGKTHLKESMLQMSKSKTSTGVFRVYKETNKKSKQGFNYVYQYFEGKRRLKIKSQSLDVLKEKVLARGLTWQIL